MDHRQKLSVSLRLPYAITLETYPFMPRLSQTMPKFMVIYSTNDQMVTYSCTVSWHAPSCR